MNRFNLQTTCDQQKEFRTIKKARFWSQLLLFVTALLLIVISREYFLNQLIIAKVESYQTHTFLGIGANIVLIFVSLFFIKTNGLSKVAGISDVSLSRWPLLLFPFLYLVLLNALTMDALNFELILPNLLTLIVYVISVGIAEELSIRGFLQSHLLSIFSKTKRGVVFSVFIASLFFGVIHLINFDKGLYGEISQVFYATFIGLTFGFLLIITKSIYPLIIIHAINNFIAGLDSAGAPIIEKISNPTSLENAILIVFLALPCFLYGLFLIRKMDKI